MVLKTGPVVLGYFLTEVPDMAKTTEAATVQVCSLKLATSVRVFSGAPLESGRLEMLSVSGIVTHTAAARW